MESDREQKYKSVLITSTFKDKINTNVGIRSYLADGMSELLGEAAVVVRPLELASDAILQYRPQLIVAVGSLVPDNSDMLAIRHSADAIGARVALWLHDDPYEIDYSFKADPLADIVFSNDLWSVSHYRHRNVHHLPLGASPKVHYRHLMPMNERTTDVFFCGVAYENRIDLVRRADRMLSQYSVEILGEGWPRDLRCAENRRLSPEEMADHASAAHLTLNIGRDLDIANLKYGLPASTPGPRTFEVALSGSAQLYAVSGLEICDYFEADKEILLIDSVSDIKDALERARDEPESIFAIAESAQRRALTEHTYVARARRMLEICSLTTS